MDNKVYKYSEYSSERIVNDTYKALADKILDLAITDDMKEKMSAILYEGGFDGYGVNLENRDYVPQHKDSPHLEAERRLQYAYLLAKNPEAFEVMKKIIFIYFMVLRLMLYQVY